MQQKKYSKEFRLEAIRMAERDGVAAAAEKLGIAKRNIYEWRRVQRLEKGEVLKGLLPGETVEQGFKRQEKELAELREANHILKKAMGFMVGR